VRVFPTVVGITYLLTSEVSLSLWFFYLFTKAQLIMAYYMGYYAVSHSRPVLDARLGQGLCSATSSSAPTSLTWDLCCGSVANISGTSCAALSDAHRRAKENEQKRFPIPSRSGDSWRLLLL
jgi:hypothetical protein